MYLPILWTVRFHSRRVVNENAAGQTIENEAQITVGHDPQITTNKTETEVKTGSLTISKTDHGK